MSSLLEPVRDGHYVRRRTLLPNDRGSIGKVAYSRAGNEYLLSHR